MLIEYVSKSKLKKRVNEGDSNLLLNELSFIWIGVIIPMLLVIAFFKVTQQKVYLSVNTVLT